MTESLPLLPFHAPGAVDGATPSAAPGDTPAPSALSSAADKVRVEVELATDGSAVRAGTCVVAAAPQTASARTSAPEKVLSQGELNEWKEADCCPECWRCLWAALECGE